MVKRAFSFIELVVAIVVMGIVFLTVPLILTETQKSTELSIQQEAVMAGMTQLVNIMSYRWDENQTDDALNGGYAKVLDTQSPVAELQCKTIGGSRWRIGHFRKADRRRCYNDPRYASTLGPDGSDLDDIDDIIVANKKLLAEANTTEKLDAPYEYKKEYDVKLDVNYTSDGFVNYKLTTLNGSIPTASVGNTSANSTNIKMITATISSPEGEKVVVLQTFLTNIGEYKIYHKTVAP